MVREPVNKKNIPKEKIEYLYNVKHLLPKNIGKKFNCGGVTINNKLKSYNIKFKPYLIKCKICEKPVEIKSTLSRNKKCCSKRCMDKDYYLRVRRENELKDYSSRDCPICHTNFVPPLRNPNKVYCRKECWKEANRNKFKQYEKRYNKDYYKKNRDLLIRKTKEWKINNPDKYKEVNKRTYQKNRDKIIKKTSEWYNNKKIIENRRRKKLGLPLIGKGFKSEMELLIYIHSLFQNYKILTHHRKALRMAGFERLELDIYIPELRLAFEYMGEQHYNKEKYLYLTKYHTGGTSTFEEQKYRDRCKKRLCKLKGITLIKVRYDEELSEQLVLKKLKHTKFIKLTNQGVLINENK